MSAHAVERLRERFGSAILGSHALCGDETVVVDPAHYLEIARFLRDEPDLAFAQMIDLTAFDTLGLNDKTIAAVGGVAGRFHVVVHLRSIESGKRLRLKAVLDLGEDDEAPEIDTISSLWKSALWAERECWDMYGIKFRGHPDLRRLLMYEEFIGHPLRKDYPKEKRQPLARRDFS